MSKTSPPPNTAKAGDTRALRLIGSLDAIAPEAWDACAGDPFTSHAFLHALEASGAVAGETGWAPCHLLCEEEGTLMGCLPLYLKSHSRGEYVFDQGWAEALERAGGRYYPKLQACVPFTPVPGRRLLVRGDAPCPRAVEESLLKGGLALMARVGASSLHMTFATRTECDHAETYGFLTRTGVQFHWRNKGYTCFDDFLGALTSRRRKSLRKERAAVAASDLKITHLTGDALTPEIWDTFFAFYMDTGARKWGHPYLTRESFARLGRSMRARLLLIMAEREGRAVAGALHVIGAKTLYGRYWGCLERERFLHFELCYYRAIEEAIRRGLETVEAGAQGGHKYERGYEPVLTYSAHAVAHDGLRAALDTHLEEERGFIDRDYAALNAQTPFAKERQET